MAYNRYITSIPPTSILGNALHKRTSQLVGQCPCLPAYSCQCVTHLFYVRRPFGWLVLKLLLGVLGLVGCAVKILGRNTGGDNTHTETVWERIMRARLQGSLAATLNSRPTLATLYLSRRMTQIRLSSLQSLAGPMGPGGIFATATRGSEPPAIRGKCLILISHLSCLDHSAFGMMVDLPGEDWAAVS